MRKRRPRKATAVDDGVRHRTQFPCKASVISSAPGFLCCEAGRGWKWFCPDWAPEGCIPSELAAGKVALGLTVRRKRGGEGESVGLPFSTSHLFYPLPEGCRSNGVPLGPEFSAESDPGPKLPIPTLTVSASARPRKASGLTTSQSLHLCYPWKTRDCEEQSWTHVTQPRLLPGSVSWGRWWGGWGVCDGIRLWTILRAWWVKLVEGSDFLRGWGGDETSHESRHLTLPFPNIQASG